MNDALDPKLNESILFHPSIPEEIIEALNDITVAQMFFSNLSFEQREGIIDLQAFLGDACHRMADQLLEANKTLRAHLFHCFPETASIETQKDQEGPEPEYAGGCGA